MLLTYRLVSTLPFKYTKLKGSIFWYWEFNLIIIISSVNILFDKTTLVSTVKLLNLYAVSNRVERIEFVGLNKSIFLFLIDFYFHINKIVSLFLNLDIFIFEFCFSGHQSNRYTTCQQPGVFTFFFYKICFVFYIVWIYH